MSEYKCQNGDPIRVGGVYKTSDDSYAIIAVTGIKDNSEYPIEFGINGMRSGALESELPRDQDGFYTREGDAQPVPDDWVVRVKFADGDISIQDIARVWVWRRSGQDDEITAFRVISTGKSAPEWPGPEAEVPLSDAGLVFEEPVSAMDVQEGGDHYKSMPIQPMEFSMANGMDACQHTIIKYVSRFRNKGGIEDLRKAKHCIDMLIEFEVKALERGES
jgi:hypothetical protein